MDAGAPPYREIRKLDDGLWVLDDTWKRSPMDRRMTVMALGDGRLAVHNAIVLADEGMRELESLGRVAYVLAPNLFHGSEAGSFASRYPDAKVFVPAGAARKLAKTCSSIDGTFEEDWPADLDGVLRCQPMAGMRLHESIFLHVPTRTLVLTDMCMNLTDRYKGLMGWFLRWNGIVDQFGASKLARMWFFKDKARLGQSLATVLYGADGQDAWDFDRVVINHGEILASGGLEKLRETFAFLPGCEPRP